MKRWLIITLLAGGVAMLLAPSAGGSTRVSEFNWNSIRLLQQNGDLHNWASWVEGGLTRLGGVPGTGEIYYVDSGRAVEGDGTSWTQAKKTLNAALALTTASRGDVILVAEGHAETISTAALSPTVSKAGVSVFGLGHGTLAPTFTVTHVDGTVDVNAPNTRLSNLRFVANVDDTKVLLTLNAQAGGSIIDNCVFRDTAANKDYLVGIQVTTPNDVRVLHNCFKTTAEAGGNNAILSAANTGLEIIGNNIYGKFATGGILTSAPLVRAVIADNIVVNAEAAIAIALNGTTSTGILARNLLGGTTSIAAALTGEDAMWCFENYVTGEAGASGIIDPTVDAD